MPDRPKAKRARSFWDEITENRIVLLSVVGSVASICARAITLLDKIAFEKELSPQVAAWRFILMLTCIFCIAATALFSYHWAALVFYDENLPYHKRIVLAALRVVLGLFLIGVFLDGFYAALYWNIWLYGIVKTLMELRKLFL